MAMHENVRKGIIRRLTGGELEEFFDPVAGGLRVKFDSTKITLSLPIVVIQYFYRGVEVKRIDKHAITGDVIELTGADASFPIDMNFK